MPEEVGLILDNLESVRSKKYGDLEIFSGKLKINDNKEVLITTAWSGWGKVSAARAATRLLSTDINSKPIEIAIFTGVAGAVDPKLKQWDMILADSLIQHDMDSRPLFEKYVIPAIKRKKISPNINLLDYVFSELKEELHHHKIPKLGSLFKGLIATGDMFISNKEKLNQLNKEILELSAIEMEGASFAQVAFQEKVEWLVIRVISDEANDNASIDFNKFINEYKLYSFDLIKALIFTLTKE